MIAYYMSFIQTALEKLPAQCEDGEYLFSDGTLVNAKEFAEEVEDKIAQLLRDEDFKKLKEENNIELDVDEMCEEISKNTDVDLEIVNKVIDAETEYLVKVGIAERV